MSSSRMMAVAAIFVQSACWTTPLPKEAPAPQTAACPEPPTTKGDWQPKLDDGKPPLPDGLACLAWPMEEQHAVTATFRDPHHPFVPGRHEATDIGAPAGTPVLAPVGGTVVWLRAVAPCVDAAVQVRIDAHWTYETHHLSRIDVKDGERLQAGDRIGLSGGAVGAPGSGPWTTGPHLHFGLAHDGAYVNAQQYFCP